MPQSPRNENVVVDVSPLGVLEITGPDALTFLQGQTSNDVLALEVGQGVPLLFCNPKGGILADATCYRTGEATCLLICDRDRAEHLVGRLARYLMLADAELVDRSDETPAWLLAGPDPPVAALTAEERGGAWLLGSAIRLGRVPTVVVLGPRPEGGELSGDDLEAVRIEEGVPRYGAELSDEELPQNALLHDHVSFDKGCFTGQEPIARLHYRGKPARELRGLLFASDGAPPEPGAEVGDGSGSVVGRVTSAARSAAMGRPIALAYLKRKAWKLSEVEVAGAGRAEVVELPLYPAS